VQNICEVKSKGTEVGTLNVLKLGHSEFEVTGRVTVV
jgi:hypothetical protein